MASAASLKPPPEFRDLSPTSRNFMKVNLFKIGPSEALVDPISVECRHEEDQFTLTTLLSANTPPTAPSPSRYQLVVRRNPDKDDLTILFKGTLNHTHSRLGVNSPEREIVIMPSQFPELRNKIYTIFEAGKALPLATLLVKEP